MTHSGPGMADVRPCTGFDRLDGETPRRIGLTTGPNGTVRAGPMIRAGPVRGPMRGTTPG